MMRGAVDQMGKQGLYSRELLDRVRSLLTTFRSN